MRHSARFGEAARVAAPRVDLQGTMIEPGGSVVANSLSNGTVTPGRRGDLPRTAPARAYPPVEPAAEGGHENPALRVAPRAEAPSPFDRLRRRGAGAEGSEARRPGGPVEGSVAAVEALMQGGLGDLLAAEGAIMRKEFAAGRSFVPPSSTRWTRPGLPGLPEHRGGRARPLASHPEARRGGPAGLAGVLWPRTGDRLRQHDRDVRPDATAAVFDNDAFTVGFAPRTFARARRSRGIATP